MDERLDLLLELPLLGLPVHFAADSPALLDAVLAAYPEWRAPAGTAAPATSPGSAPAVRIRLRLDHERAAEPLVEDAPPAVRVTGDRLELVAPGAIGAAELPTLEASASLDPRRLADPARLRADVLDTLALFLLTRLDRQPLHAAAVARGGTAALLAGPGGVGKSTLAWAAARAGLRVLSDDAVYLQLRPRLRVWGSGAPMHLLADDDRPHALPADAPLRERGGRLKAAIPLAALPGTPPVAERTLLCLLERGVGRVTLQRIDAEGAVSLLLSTLEPGFDAFRDTLPPALRALAAGGAWRLRLSPDPDEAVAAVEKLLRGA